MQSNLLHRAPARAPNGKQVKKCGFCKHNNPVAARFCGGCGRSTRFSRVEIISPPVQPSSDESSETSARRPWSRLLSLRKFCCRNRTLATVLLLVLLIALTGALYISEPPGKPGETAKWRDFRAFLARKLEIPHYELDTIFFELFSLSTDEKALISKDQAILLESYFKDSFNQKSLSIFPNPFFEKPLSPENIRNLANAVFADVSPVHPIYEVTAPLARLGVKCADSENKIHPDDKMSWSDWHNITSDLFRSLGLETSFIDRLCYNKSGPMSNIDLRNFSEHLREKLYIKNTEPLIYAREQFYPSRLEAFGILNAIIREMNEG